MFFVGTAPSGDGGHVNVSPKGPIGTLRLLDDHTLAYLDLVGSGAETDRAPARERPHRRDVLRVRGSAADPPAARPRRGPAWRRARVPRGERAGRSSDATVIRVDVERIADSCGYGVPLMSFVRASGRNSRAWAEGKLAKGGPERARGLRGAAQRREHRRAPGGARSRVCRGRAALRGARGPRACTPRQAVQHELRRVRRRPARLAAAHVDD